MQQFSFSCIGHICSPYKEKFAVPRQPNLVSAGHGELHLIPPYNHPDAVRGLDQFSHIWLLFIFDKITKQNWQPLIRPPRLGGNQKIGVFASRSTFRPNPIGLSSVELRDIVINKTQVILKLGSLDLVDGTPIIDIKPYIPYSDAHPLAQAGYAQTQPDILLSVVFSEQAKHELSQYQSQYAELTILIQQIIEQDPRPAYKKHNEQKQEYGFCLYDFNIRWQVQGHQAIVLSVSQK